MDLASLPDPPFLAPPAPSPTVLPTFRPHTPADHPADEPDTALLDPEWSREPAPEFLDDGTPLKLTFSRRELFLEAFPHAFSGPTTLSEGSFLLFLAAVPRTTWTAPIPDPEYGLLAPLYTRPHAFNDHVTGWKDRNLALCRPHTILAQATRLWTSQHSSQVIIPHASKKKAPELVTPPESTPPGRSATSSPSATPSAPPTSTMSSPSGESTPPSTVTS
jgi:hypothetical protein